MYINPVTIGKVKWEQYRLLTESKLRAAQPVTVLVRPPPPCPVIFLTHKFLASQLVPLSRHSPLNELRAFVSLFRPARVVPNTLDRSLRGLDALCIPNIFAGCLSNPRPLSSSAFADGLSDELEIATKDGGDSALQNPVGDDAERIAGAWADSGCGVEKLAVVEQFLTGHDTARHGVRRVLGLAPLPRDGGVERAVSMLQRIRDKQRIRACRGRPSSVGESDEETERDDSDAHSRTARMLFGVESQQQSQEEGRVSTPPVSECDSSRHVTHLDLSPGRLLDTGDALADPRPRPSPSCLLIAHGSSPPSSLTSPRRSKGDPPPLKNTPLTGTKRQRPWSYCQSPPTIHLHTPKRGKVSAVVAQAVEQPPRPAGSFIATRLNMDVDDENCKGHRRALRARSRAIEEKLRRALFVTASPPLPDKIPWAQERPAS